MKHHNRVTSVLIMFMVAAGTLMWRLLHSDQVGSTAWKSFMSQACARIPGSLQDLKTLVVRHPLGRLVSAYKDKYLNGSPLNTYDKAYRKVTGSHQTWNDRWQEYWLPALIHKGSVAPSPQYLTTLKKVSQAYGFLTGKRFGTFSRHRLNETKKASSNPERKFITLAKKMLTVGKHVGVVAAVNIGYSTTEQSKLKKYFSNASFTMAEFLEHVLWTRDVDLLDHHWTPISQLCGPCTADYKYIVRHENPKEAEYLLGLLHLQENTIPRKHKSIGALHDKSDLQYFEDVPKDLMAIIIDMYKQDFDLFSYDKISK
ncbi:uncharacterized protein LOC121859524 isoform X2 [Homarus americanus]|uniref:uncharacterized protein LOC121859524 isoform X2 n=1 Tax=Homarus americanus TaxID=6706 RepID=UPI001C46B90D|nr:uncharacterized protein LOC121859524 isoform X2 [Homarus americanus]